MGWGIGSEYNEECGEQRHHDTFPPPRKESRVSCGRRATGRKAAGPAKSRPDSFKRRLGASYAQRPIINVSVPPRAVSTPIMWLASCTVLRIADAEARIPGHEGIRIHYDPVAEDAT